MANKSEINISRITRRVLAASTLLLTVAACQMTPPNPKGGENPILSQSKLMDLGQNAEARGESNAALAFYQQANLGFPSDPAPLLGLARLYGKLGSHQESSAAYSKLAELSKGQDRINYHVAAGRALLLARDAIKAEAAFEQALAQDNASIKALNGLGIARDLQGRHGEAQEIYRTILEIDAINRSAINNLALSLMVTGDTEQATGLLETLSRKHNQNENYVRNLAMAYGMAGQMDLARTVLETIAQGRQVENNLVAFQKLGKMSPTERARFIFNSQLAGN